MRVRNAVWGVLGAAVLLTAAPAAALPVSSGVVIVVPAEAGSPELRVDYRPYYHCHGPKRCHGKGNYYKYTPSDAPIVQNCRYGRGCGYNNGWNSPSSRYDYIGNPWRHRHRHRHRHHRH